MEDPQPTSVPVNTPDSTGHVAAPQQEHDLVQTDVQGTSLELLSAAAEIKRLQQQVHQSEVLFNEYRVWYEQHEATLGNPVSDDKPKPLTVQEILKEESQIQGLFEYYTGFKFSTFQALLDFLTIQAQQHHNNRKDIVNMECEDKLLLTLMRLRHNFGLKDLAFRFAISTQAVICRTGCEPLAYRETL
ncbi:uncharacterized protein LOC110452471 [Mizuhopecten yessoensis]|uniref:uncharacterized protein LOC110452471 n=1 Tax=Mizuhopecten yessoensis TaxID=6573 RepID=UPI000B45BFD1|nr:uncharacterized protein LOC110452471 [Mizuhopecten yessoensis]